MISCKGSTIHCMATVITVALLFLSCQDQYERIGEEKAPLIYPQGIAENFVLTYSEAPEKLNTEDNQRSKVIAVLRSPMSEDFDNLLFQYRTFPKGLEVTFFDEQNNRSQLTADYGIIYSNTNLLDLRGNVKLETHDGKTLEAPQLYWDRKLDWIFTQQKFKFTNPEDGTIMDGEGMDFDRSFNFFTAHKTYGLMTLKESDS